jgi:hypothetical protein
VTLIEVQATGIDIAQKPARMLISEGAIDRRFDASGATE